MKMNKWYGVMVVSICAVGSLFSQEISSEQESQLTAIGLEYDQRGTQLEGQLQSKLSELALELMREGRLDSEKVAKASAKRTNAILKDVGGLYGELIQTEVEYMLKAKNVLTLEQKLELLSQMEPEVVMHYGESEFLQPDIFDLPLNLDVKQRKKLINLEANLLIKEIKLERDIELTLLKLETELLAETIDPSRVDKQVMGLAKLAAKAIENRVEFILDAKDSLTLDQKRQLADLLELN